MGCFLDFSPGVAEEFISVGDPFNRCVWWLLCLVERIWQSLVKTAQSSPPESAGSRSPERWGEGVDAAAKGSAETQFACGVRITFDCAHGPGCTAEWWNREYAEEAGRSRRQRRWCVPGGGLFRGRGNSVSADAPVAAAKGEQGLRLMPRDQIQTMQPQQEKVVRCQSNDLSGWFKSQCTPVTGPGE